MLGVSHYILKDNAYIGLKSLTANNVDPCGSGSTTLVNR
jgi:hypothetical protein